MRKSLIILLAAVLFTLVAMAACNIDATIGIYSEAAQSTPSTDVVVRNFIGYFNGDYYYLADDGLYKKNENTKETKTLFKSSDTERIVNAYLELVGSTAHLYVFKDSKDMSQGFPTTLTYYADVNNLGNGNVINGQYKGMLPNGFVWTDKLICYLKNGSANTICATADENTTFQVLAAFKSEMTYGGSNDRYGFFNIKVIKETGTDSTGNKTYEYKYRYYVLNATTGTIKIDYEVTDTTMQKRSYCGFQCLTSDDEFMLLYMDTSGSSNYSYAKKLTAAGVSDYVTLTDNMKYSVSQNASFYDPVADRVIVKCTNYFDEINLSDGSITQRKQQYAANICTADISDFVRKEAGSNIFIVGTANSFLYSIDMDNPDNNPVQL